MHLNNTILRTRSLLENTDDAVLMSTGSVPVALAKFLTNFERSLSRGLLATAVLSSSLLSRCTSPVCRYLVPLSGRIFHLQSLVIESFGRRTANTLVGVWTSTLGLSPSTTWTHRGMLQVLKDCRMLALDAARFANLMGVFPTQHVVAYAERFVQHLTEICCWQCSTSGTYGASCCGPNSLKFVFRWCFHSLCIHNACPGRSSPVVQYSAWVDV